MRPFDLSKTHRENEFSLRYDMPGLPVSQALLCHVEKYQGGHKPGKHRKPGKLREVEKLPKSQGKLREILIFVEKPGKLRENEKYVT